MTSPSNMALSFDAEKVGDHQINSGRKFTLKVKPGEAPDEFVNAELGSRWKVVVVRLGENDEPLPPSQPQDKKAKQTQWEMGPVQQAGMFVKDRAFQNLLNEKVTQVVHDETTAIEAIYQLFSITSRRYLADDPECYAWKTLVNEYRDIWEQSHYGDMR